MLAKRPLVGSQNCDHSLVLDGKYLILVKLHGKLVAYGSFTLQPDECSEHVTTSSVWSNLSQSRAVGVPLQLLLPRQQARAEIQRGFSACGHNGFAEFLREDEPISVRVFAKLRHFCSAQGCPYARVDGRLLRRTFEPLQFSSMGDEDYSYFGAQDRNLIWFQLPGVLRKDPRYLPSTFNGDEPIVSLDFDTQVDRAAWTFFWDLKE